MEHAQLPTFDTSEGGAIVSLIDNIKNLSSADAAKLTGRQIKRTKASDITPKHLQWLWRFRIPVGMFGLLAGREGIGKTLTLIDIAAKLTRGTLEGEYFGTPKTVMISALEDSWEHTIVPRLMAAGAELDRVERLEIETVEGLEGVSLPKDLAALQNELADSDVVLLVIDPLISQLAGKLDTHKDSDVRKALHPLVKLAEDAKISVIGIIHQSKKETTDALNTIMGSRAFTAVSRYVLFAMEDPHDESLRYLGHVKSNLGPKQKTLTYEVEEVKVDGFAAPKMKWTGHDPRSIREILSAPTGTVKAPSPAESWLEKYLRQHPNGVDSATVKAEGVKAGFGDKTLQRAADKIGAEIRHGGFPRKTTWGPNPFVKGAP